MLSLGVFATFYENKFVDDILLDEVNIETTRERLKDFDTSVHFFNFLATYVDYKDDYKQLPFLTQMGMLLKASKISPFSSTILREKHFAHLNGLKSCYMFYQ